jgi:hypothetical protein
LGDRHPDVATSLNNLAVFYESQQRYGEAEELYVRSLEIKQQVLPNEHPSLKRGWKNFETFLQQVIDQHRTAALSAHPLTR